MRALRLRSRQLVVALIVILAAGVACSRDPETASAKPATAATSSGAYYSNGWSDDDRRTAYHLSTGGEVLSLALLQSLERSKLPQEGADGLAQRR